MQQQEQAYEAIAAKEAYTAVGKRLFAYGKLYKKPILLALLLLIIAVTAELAGPLIARQMIDQGIMGIERPWHEVEEELAVEDAYAVSYNGAWYKRADRFAAGELQGGEVRVLQVGRAFYFVDTPIAFDGRREVAEAPGEVSGNGGSGEVLQLTITRATDGETAVYAAARLTREQLYGFYAPELPGLLRLAALYLGLLVVAALFTYGQRLMLQTSANKVVQRMRQDVFKHTQRLPVQYYDNLAAGQVVSRITNDTEAIRELYVNVLANFFTAIVYMTAILGALFVLDWRLGLIALPMVPLLIGWIVLYRKFAVRYNRVIRAKLSEINAMINESIQGMPIIQAFRREQATAREFETLNETYQTYQNKLLSLNSLTSHNLLNVLRNVIFLVVIWLFWGNQLGAAVTVGVLYAFIDYMNRMFTPIVGVVSQLSNLEIARVSAQRVFTLMDAEGVEVTSGSMPRYKGRVAFEHVTFAYRKGDPVLRDITFTAEQGQTLALVGHTGSGKSSILNLLFRFYEVEEGRITIDGTDLRELPRQHVRQHMGIVLQDPYLFTGTIASNVSLNNPAISRERVVAALQEVGVYERFMKLPGGIDAPVIEKGSTLSAGERQLISFARALAYDPAILILDEATASIDSETEAIIQAALDVLKRGRTTFVIAHRLSTIRQADQILVLDRGRIVERGNHDELMEQGGKYYAMYQLQQGAEQTTGQTTTVQVPG